MGNYILTNKAVEDLTSIWNYTFDEWSEKQADKYYDMLMDSFQEIAKNPNLGRHYSGIADNLFGIRVTKHIVFYRKINNDQVEITRVLHERMDLKRRIQE